MRRVSIALSVSSDPGLICGSSCNIAVHQYQALDPAIVLAIADKHLGDLHVYAARVLDHLGLK